MNIKSITKEENRTKYTIIDDNGNEIIGYKMDTNNLVPSVVYIPYIPLLITPPLVEINNDTAMGSGYIYAPYMASYNVKKEKVFDNTGFFKHRKLKERHERKVL